jgi:hypothetical protein
MPHSVERLEIIWMDVVCETTGCTIESPIPRRVSVDDARLPDWDSLLILAGFFLEKLLIDDVEQCPEGHQEGAGFWVPYRFLFGGEPCYVRFYRAPPAPPVPAPPAGGPPGRRSRG